MFLRYVFCISCVCVSVKFRIQTQNQLHILIYQYLALLKIAQNWQNALIIDLTFCQILPFSQYAQNTKQFISIDSPSWAEQNGTNEFVIACTDVKIQVYFGVLLGRGKLGFFVSLRTNNSATKYDITKLVTPFHSESTAHSNNINISYW